MRRHASMQDYISRDREGPCALCIGNFDGVHLGHRHVIQTCMKRARGQDLSTVVLTFEPHPLEVLRPSKAPQRLTTPDSRASLLATTGLDHLVEHPFDHQLASVTAEDFVRSFIVDGLRASVVVVGSRFQFGHRRRGDVDLLMAMGRDLGFEVRLARGFRLNGEVVSSRRIRRLLGEKGQVERASRLLGRRHCIRGRTVRGEGRGRGLGFPTANLDGIAEIVPAPGVYACETTVDGRQMPAAVHVGPRLTFDSVSTVEAHIVGWEHERNLYDTTLDLTFIQHLRHPRRFSDPGALVEQIREDVRQTVQAATNPPAIEVRP